MADPPPYPDSNSDTGDDVRTDRGSTTTTPRWVKVFEIIAIVLVFLFVILHLTGGGLGRHTPSGGPDDHTPPIKHGVQQP